MTHDFNLSRIAQKALLMVVVLFVVAGVAAPAGAQTHRITVVNQSGSTITVSLNVGNHSATLQNGQKTVFSLTPKGGLVLRARIHSTGKEGSQGISSPAWATYGIGRLANGGPDIRRLTRVEIAEYLLAEGRAWPSGCSQFVSEVLQIPSGQSANALVGPAPKYVGVNNKYSGLRPGDIVGWVKQPNGHVAVYIGKPGRMFIDVPGFNQRPREVKNGYGPEKLYKSSR